MFNQVQCLQTTVKYCVIGIKVNGSNLGELIHGGNGKSSRLVWSQERLFMVTDVMMASAAVTF